MANNLPPGVLPKLFRQRNSDGKEVGAWYIKIKKKPVNLRTQVYSKARDRARQAFFENVRDFMDDRFFEEPAPATPAASVETSSTVPLDDLAADVGAAAAAGLQPDAYFDGKGREVPLLSAVPEGAERAPSDAPATPDEPPKSSDDTTKIDPQMFANMMNMAANVLVEGQFMGQAFLIKRGLKRECAPVPADDKSRLAAVQLWEHQLAKWVPQEIPLPEWASAMLVVGTFGIMSQLENSKPIVKEDASSAPAPAYATG